MTFVATLVSTLSCRLIKNKDKLLSTEAFKLVSFLMSKGSNGIMPRIRARKPSLKQINL
jgi:hypothetical protein